MKESKKKEERKKKKERRNKERKKERLPDRKNFNNKTFTRMQP